MTKIDDYMTLQEAAEALKTTYSTVWRWTQNGSTPYITRFKVRLIHRKDCKRPTYKDGRGTTNFGRKKSEAKP